MQKIRAIRLFEHKDNVIPADSYPIDWRDSGIGFAIHNWLEMHPEGKVEFSEVVVQ